MFKKPKKKNEESKKPTPKDKYDPLTAAIIVAILVAFISVGVNVLSLIVEEYYQSWGGFALLALMVVILVSMTAGVGAFWKSDKQLRLALGSSAGLAAFGTLTVLVCWWVEQYYLTWGGFIFLALDVTLTFPLTAAFAAWEWTKYINRMVPPVAEERQPLDEEWFRFNEEPPQEEELIP